MFVELFDRFVLPKSTNEDEKREEFILNVLLFATILLFVFANIVSVIASVAHPESYKHNSVALAVLFLALLFSSSLYFLSRKGFFRLASYLLLGTFFLLATYMACVWGVDVNAGILLFVLLIVMSGVLISTQFAFVTNGVVVVTMIMIDVLQKSHVIAVNRYWRSEAWTYTDTAMTAVIFLIIATVSWLSNREIEKSLARARKSEADLMVERDLLEIKVEERTRELKEAQSVEMAQLYRFAEFGRISSGLFHDLVNPLTAVTLNIEKIKNENDSGSTIAEVKMYVDQAVRATKKMEDFVLAVRKQLARKESRALFSLNEEIKNVIDILSHQAQKVGVEISFSQQGAVILFGDAMKLNQAVLNLVANAIDSYEPSKDWADERAPSRRITVSLREENGAALFSVKDHGVGISEENMHKIYEPFFTTKAYGNGIGIGLSITKRIIEKDFRGSIEVKSKENQGSEFLVRFPIPSQIMS